MYVTEIRKLDSKKYLVLSDGTPAFALYKSELEKYKVEAGQEIEEEDYATLHAVLKKRCRERAGYILGKSDKTEQDLRNKLKQGYYPEEIIERIIDDFKSYGYLNDKRYAENYVKYNSMSKSRKRIYNELAYKGVKKEYIDSAFDKFCEEEQSEYESAQSSLILKEFNRKRYDFINEDQALRNKIIASLLRKGFLYDEIMEVYYDRRNEMMHSSQI